MTWLVNTSYKAIRTKKYKYIHWIHHQDVDELYDLSHDPYELTNLIKGPDHQEIAIELRSELVKLVAESVGL